MIVSAYTLKSLQHVTRHPGCFTDCLNNILNVGLEKKKKPNGHIEGLFYMLANEKPDQCPSAQHICSYKSLTF